MRNDFVYAIPSYNRADKQTTVNYLNTIGVKKEKIYVFVQTRKDEKEYKEKIGDMANIVMREANRGVEARNNILNELCGENNVVMLDDDVRAIGELHEREIKKIITAKRMEHVLLKCFEMCEKTNVRMFGIYPVYNAFFMEKTISTKAPINTVFGIVAGSKIKYDESYDTKEDAALCAKLLSFGASILRFNFLAVDADHRKTKDGYIDDWHQEENIRCVKKLLMEFPTIYKAQKNKPWEVRTTIKDKKVQISEKKGEKRENKNN